MKILFLISIAMLSACSACNIPMGTYETTGGTEYTTVLTFSKDFYTIDTQSWQPGNYASRTKKTSTGKFVCKGNHIELVQNNKTFKGKWREIGNNPLGFPKTYKAIVFAQSDESVYSNEIFYPVPVTSK